MGIDDQVTYRAFAEPECVEELPPRRLGEQLEDIGHGHGMSKEIYICLSMCTADSDTEPVSPGFRIRSVEEMRMITANVYMTVDGRGEFPRYPGWDRDTGESNVIFDTMWKPRYDDVTTVVMGRRSFTGHRKTWTEKARKPKDPKYAHDFARFLDRVDKVCLSHRLKTPGWENSRIMKGDLSRIVAKLKRERGGNIIIEGGPRLIFEVLRRDLADDYWFIVMPVVYGRGPKYWGEMGKQCTLKLLESKTAQDGEILLHYEAVHGFKA